MYPLQIPLLLSMREEELALQKAVNSEDTDLIYLTLIHVERSRTDYVRYVCVKQSIKCLIELHCNTQYGLKYLRALILQK